MANNELNIHGANLEDLQKTADRCSKPEDLAASQPESPAEAADQYAESEYSESSGQQETADQHSRPEAPAASNQPEDPLAALRRALKAREDAKPEAPIPSLETQAAETRLALGIGRTAFRAVDMLENPTGKPPADSLGEPESNSERQIPANLQTSRLNVQTAIRLSPILKANLSRQKIKRSRGAQMSKIQMNR